VRHVLAQLECKLERRVEQVSAQDVVTHVLQVIVWLQDTPAEEVEAVHHGNAKVLDGTQNVFEGDQVSAEQTARNSIESAAHLHSKYSFCNTHKVNN
jgi:ATP-dependent Clp protease adapter protein ClpS